MENDFIVDLASGAIKVAVMLAAPMLLGALVIGILVSIFQAVTQINEQTLSFIPKILVIMGILVLGSPWMLDTLTDYTTNLYTNIPKMVMQK
ncbi:MAG: flagellar biosynthesis protein FliQ [Bacteriovoracaceae bacterium]|jgi:flagellar biosynthesis protein FliQ|nr:flagellar biosynthesis protein FliQ [Bacteriovoracaceae bacterium]